MRPFTVVTTIALLIGLLTTPFAEAGRLWCHADPVVSIDDRIIDISLAIPLEYLLLVDGPTVYEITVPAGVDRHLILNDLGFGRGSVVTFHDGGTVQDNHIPIVITASVSINTTRLPTGATIPMQLNVVVEALESTTIAVMTAVGTTDHTETTLVVPIR